MFHKYSLLDFKNTLAKMYQTQPLNLQYHDLEFLIFHVTRYFFELGFTPCKFEQPLQGIELQKKKHKKIKAYKKSV